MFTYQINHDVSLAIPNPRRDAEPLFNLINNNRDWYKQWLPWVDYIKSVTGEIIYLHRCLVDFANERSLNAIIMDKGKIAGMISFNGFRQLDHSADIGYWLGLPYQHHGIATNATHGLCQLGFNDYNLNKVIINASVDNHASNEVAKRCSFHLDGRLRANELLNGIYHDENRWSLLKAEFK
ncbi:GNAT family N-acetyltransferase [Acetilactobacillus jinshanensis]|uniref:N-acetyltransferase n=1 Tax=Acetilactobacillus jinshanensis TaxID=1720083 RepID=A0A4P6ZLZ7_9LACO|nr:GNAT family protein [Acetilactobacillus jinshanensis]QBP18597.1 N-acetyltransferase [Acetilactobacillus jinshanensis]URL61473.1 GNAT family N-acetyltransferase [uncultured bacterium]